MAMRFHQGKGNQLVTNGGRKREKGREVKCLDDMERCGPVHTGLNFFCKLKSHFLTSSFERTGQDQIFHRVNACICGSC